VLTPTQARLDLPVRRLPVRFEGDVRRVIVRPFVMSNSRVRALFDRLQGFGEEEVEDLLRQVRAGYGDRHKNLDAAFDEHFALGTEVINWRGDWSPARRALAGAYMTMEYAIDSAALFNPSIVLHPDQSGLPEGAVRFLMSLRATGEGHVSSIVFRTGVITADLRVCVDSLPTKLHRARVHPDRLYVKNLFRWKLFEMGVSREPVERLMERLAERFGLSQLTLAVEEVRPSLGDVANASEALRTALWLAQSNYKIELPTGTELSELVIFPMNDEESRGIEDLRMVRFIEEDGGVEWFGTYTAYNGFRTLPMLMSCSDFRKIEVHSLNGGAALNKGMALFPRRVGSQYCMCSRIDGENLFISYSPSVHFWHKAERLIAPKFPWELMQIGNCGSPIETPEGWVLLTHGVGPMRSYAIGAMLLDLNDPLKVIGHLQQPLLTPVGEEREGYVPNVVYTCGALAHRGQLFVPFAAADKATTMAVVDLDQLINRLLDGRSFA
jgi:predicted GH43/DUF377 family glycosyl hydrolase